MKTIEISESVYSRLSQLIQGFGDTPDSIIERLLNDAEGTKLKPRLTFYPEDESKFKKLLLRDKKAEVVLYTENGEIEVLKWSASKFKESSNVKANIWSGYLRNWEVKGITKAEFTIYERPIDALKDKKHFELCELLSPLLNIPYNILNTYNFEQSMEIIDGQDMLIVQFSDGQDFTLWNKSQYFNASSKRVEIPQQSINYTL